MFSHEAATPDDEGQSISGGPVDPPRRAAEFRTAMTVRLLDHPLVQHKLTRMREIGCPSSEFRRLLREVGGLLCFEATRDLRTTTRGITTPMASMEAPCLDGRPPVVAPILRAGLGLADGILDLVTEAEVAHIGMRRDEETLRAEVYFMKAPEALDERTVIVVDPMLATGNTAISALALLARAGARDLRFVSLVAAPEGIETLRGAFPKVPIVTAAIDERLNEKAYIVPGLGDAGDRLYGTS
jgi:uracil phosphoribosyltransferase